MHKLQTLFFCPPEWKKSHSENLYCQCVDWIVVYFILVGDCFSCLIYLNYKVRWGWVMTVRSITFRLYIDIHSIIDHSSFLAKITWLLWCRIRCNYFMLMGLAKKCAIALLRYLSFDFCACQLDWVGCQSRYSLTLFISCLKSYLCGHILRPCLFGYV